MPNESSAQSGRVNTPSLVVASHRFGAFQLPICSVCQCCHELGKGHRHAFEEGVRWL